MGPLNGVKVVDLSLYAPGRWASMYLADLGAEVIGIENLRKNRPTKFRLLDDDTHPRWLWYDRNKKSITLNLKTDAGRTLFYKLVGEADVLIVSTRPETARRQGTDYESIKKVNPEIVYCAVTGFGQDGPLADVFGHETNYQGYTGVLGESGPIGGPPTLTPALVGDLGGGALEAVIGIMGAVIHKMKTGKGQLVDVSVTDGVLALTGAYPYHYWRAGQLPPPGGGVMVGGTPRLAVYETKDGKYVVTSALENWIWEKMCRALGRDDLVGRFGAKGDAREETFDELRKVFGSKTQDEWVEWNREHNVGVTPVLRVTEAVAHPHFIHRKMVVEIDYEPLGKIKQIGIPVKFSETPGEIRNMPRYGQHTAEILARLGCSREEIRKLAEEDVIEPLAE